MPVKQSQTSKTFRRHVAPFAPVALAMLMGAGPSPKPAATTEALTAHAPSKVCSVNLSSCPVSGLV